MTAVTDQILEHLRQHRHATTFDLIHLFNITRPAREIDHLRKRGLRIKTVPVKTQRKDNGKTVIYADYWLEEDA